MATPVMVPPAKPRRRTTRRKPAASTHRRLPRQEPERLPKLETFVLKEPGEYAIVSDYLIRVVHQVAENMIVVRAVRR